MKREAGCSKRVVLAGLLAAFCGEAAGELPPVRFGPHPRIDYTAEGLRTWLDSAEGRKSAGQIVAKADALLRQELEVPEEAGQWVFYYACPKDNSRLRAESAGRHVCPACGAAYTDERTQAAYRTVLNERLDADCHALALAYAVSGDPKYAVPVRKVLLKLADLYPTWSRHDRWGRSGLLAPTGGRRYCQLLDEAFSMIRLARAYDLVTAAPLFSSEDRAAVEEKLFKANVRDLQKRQVFAGSRNNHQTWFNAAYAVVGLATGDEALMRASVEGAAGLNWQLAQSVTEDGLWYEGAMAYHFYALQAIIEHLKAIRQAGWDLSGNARLKSLWSGPLDLVYPNGDFPVFHDSDPGNIAVRRGFYEWAGGYFNDAVFAGIGAANGGPAAGWSTGESRNLKGIGIAVLRRGKGGDALCAMMDYGPHGDHHGHPDKLNLVLFGLGRELLPDPGRISYSVPEYENWCRTTVAHNTLVVDGKDQAPDQGRVIFFNEDPSCVAVLAVADKAYRGVVMKRCLLMTDTFLVDIMTAQGSGKMRFDWMVHARGPLVPGLAMKPRDAPLGSGNGYQHLADLKEGAGSACTTFECGARDGGTYRILCPGDEASTVVTGHGIGYSLQERVPFVMRRRTGESAVFVTLYDMAGAPARVESAGLLALQANDEPGPFTEAVGLALALADGRRITIGVDLRECTEAGLFSIGGAAVNRCYMATAE